MGGFSQLAFGHRHGICVLFCQTWCSLESLAVELRSCISDSVPKDFSNGANNLGNAGILTPRLVALTLESCR